MNAPLVVVLDGVSQLEYQRGVALDPALREYLDRLDRRLDAGVDLGGQRIDQPNALQRAQFIARQLLDAVRSGNEAVAAAACAYLANRIPDLKQVRATTRGGLLSVELVFDKPYVNEVKVDFVRPKRSD